MTSSHGFTRGLSSSASNYSNDAAEYDGTGIGPALCQRILERHGDEITVDSGPGEGSTFTLTPPALES